MLDRIHDLEITVADLEDQLEEKERIIERLEREMHARERQLLNATEAYDHLSAQYDDLLYRLNAAEEKLGRG